jgi:hypothetical protein
MKPWHSLEGKTIWVTGGAGYLGSAITIALDAECAKVLCFDLPGRAEALVSEQKLARTRPLSLDINNAAQLPQMVEARIVSAAGMLIPKALRGGGTTNAACGDLEDYPEDGTENYRSIGVVFTFGTFRFFDPGDLSGNTLANLACPKDLIGPVSVYLISHHGNYDTAVPALYAALRPRATILNNGVDQGGHPEAFKAVRGFPAIDLWQLHRSENEGVVNAPDQFLSNVDDGTTSYTLRMTASDDGSFQMMNTRTGFFKAYRPGLVSELHAR